MTARERKIHFSHSHHIHTHKIEEKREKVINSSLICILKGAKVFFCNQSERFGLGCGQYLVQANLEHNFALFNAPHRSLPSRLACLAFNWWLYLAHSFYCQLNNWIKAKNSDWLYSSLFLTVAAGHTSFQRVHVDFCIEVIRGDDDDHCARETRIKVYTKRRQRNHGNCARLCRANKFVITCASLRFYKSFINMMSVISTRLRLLLEFASSGSESASECERGFYFFRVKRPTCEFFY